MRWAYNGGSGSREFFLRWHGDVPEMMVLRKWLVGVSDEQAV